MDEVTVVTGSCDLDDDFTDDFTGKKVYVSIPKVLKRAAKALVAQPDRWPRVLMRELKRMDNGMSVLFNESISHPETYELFADSLHSNENKCAKKLSKSMNKHYMDHLEQLGMHESVKEPIQKRTEDASHNFGGTAMPGNAGASYAGPSSGVGEVDAAFEGINGTEPNDGSGLSGAGSAAGTAPAARPKQGDPNPSPGTYFSMDKEDNNKQFGYNHLINEMGSYDNMKSAMKKYLDI